MNQFTFTVFGASCALVLAWTLPASAQQLKLESEGSLLTAQTLQTFLNRSRCLCETPIDVSFDAGGALGAMAVVAGDRCIDSEQRISDSCRVLWSRSDASEQLVSFQTTAKGIVGECTETKGDLKLWILQDALDEDSWVSLVELTLAYDMDPPGEPKKAAVVAGEGLVEVAFEAPSEETGLRYQVLCQDAFGQAVFAEPEEPVFTSAACGAEVSTSTSAIAPDPAMVCAKSKSSPASVTVLGLENGQSYSFYVVSVDLFGNASLAAKVGEATPAPEEDLWERYKRAGGAEDGGYCFVATAAYGDYDHPTVRTLRAFRDQVLFKSVGGRRLVQLYYRTSPPIARWIARYPAARATVRAVLWPAQKWAGAYLKSPFLTVSASALLLLGLAWRRRR